MNINIQPLIERLAPRRHVNFP